MLSSRSKFREAENELDRRLGDWGRYTEQLQVIARDFSTFTESRDYARAAESKAQWQAVDAWREFQPRLRQLHTATPEEASEIIKQFKALPSEAQALPTARQFRQDLIPSIEQLAGRDLENLRSELEKWFSGTWVGELKFVVKTDEETTHYCLVGCPVGQSNFAYVSGQKTAEAGWPTKKNWKKAESVEQSPQARLAEVLRSVVRKADPTGGVAVDQLFVALLEAVVNAKDVDPVPRLVTARKLVLLATDYSRPFRETGRPLTKLLDDGEAGIPGLSLDQLWSFVPPTRDQDTEYQVTRQKSETLLKEIQDGLVTIKDAIVKEQKVLMAPPMGSATLAGRLGRNDAGDLIAIWQGSAPPQGPVWWFPAGVDVSVAGTVDDKGTFRAAGATGPAGAPLFTMTSEPKRAIGTKQQTTGRED